FRSPLLAAGSCLFAGRGCVPAGWFLRLPGLFNRSSGCIHSGLRTRRCSQWLDEQLRIHRLNLLAGTISVSGNLAGGDFMSFLRIHCTDGVYAGHTQGGTSTQSIDAASESLWVGPIEGNQHLVHGDVRRTRADLLRDAPQGLMTANRPVVAGGMLLVSVAFVISSGFFGLKRPVWLGCFRLW